jgi:ATP-binding cassette subfamily B (MDR/TAP) protein 1
MHDQNSISTPVTHHFKLSALQCRTSDEVYEYMLRVPYSSLVGSFMYAIVCSRRDLLYAMSLVSIYMDNHSKKYWKVVLRIFKYIQGTSKSCSKFGKTGEGLAAADLHNRRSLIGYVFMVGVNVLRKEALQPIVFQSTTEV